MTYFVNALSIQRWADTNSARSTLPHLMRRLVYATIDWREVTRIDFPAHESAQRPGFDGEIVCRKGNARVAEGHSVWELSVQKSPGNKAKDDFNKRTETTPENERKSITYCFVTARHWRKKRKWQNDKSALGEWKEVRAYDSDDLEQWIETAPGVAVWFSSLIGNRPRGVDAVEKKWDGVAASTTMRLSPAIFLVCRERLLERLQDWLNGEGSHLAIESRSPGEVIDFVCAALVSMEDRERFQSRAIIIESSEAWPVLRDSSFPTILIVDPSFELSPEEIGRAVTKGHHVLTAIEPRQAGHTPKNPLMQPSEFELSQALEKCGYSVVEAEQHARACGGSLAILKRRLSRFRALVAPPWSREVSTNVVVPCLLLGGWEGDNQADRSAVEKLGGETYAELEPKFQTLATCRDPMLLHAAGNWRLTSKDHAWDLLGDRVSSTAVQKFESLVVEILADDDPKYGMPANDRFYAQVQGHVPKYSATLKTHCAQVLAFLGAFGDSLEAAASIKVTETLDQIVATILSPHVTWHRWATLGSRLPLLAEASPRSFLDTVQRELGFLDSNLVKLVSEDSQPLVGGCNYAGLLWSLETLAWNNHFLIPSCNALLRLAEIEPAGQWSNSPIASLCEILSYWRPHTTVGLDERIRLLDSLIRSRSDTAWKLLVKLLPHPAGNLSMNTHHPMWQTWANGWVPGIPRAESAKFITITADRLIDLANGKVDRWLELVQHLGNIPDSLHGRLIKGLEDLSTCSLTERERRKLTDELSKQINQHRHFENAAWSLPAKMVDELDHFVRVLKPKNPALQHAWLFEEWPDQYVLADAADDQHNRLAIEAARDEALLEIIDHRGFGGVEELAIEAKAPHHVGRTLARTTDDRFLLEILKLLGDERSADFVRGFVQVRFNVGGWLWADSAYSRCDSDEHRTFFLMMLPFEVETWKRVDKAGDVVRRDYWNGCTAFNPDLAEDDVRPAVQLLVENRRPADAVNLLAMAIHKARLIDSDTLLLPLESIIETDDDVTKEQISRLNSYDVGYVIETLQKRIDIEISQLIRIEWNYFGFLDEHLGRTPRILYEHLSADPEFFVQILSLCYRSQSEREDEKEAPVDQEKANLATRAWQLLENWCLIPGTIDSGAVDESILRKWCNKSRQIAKQCCRIEVCDHHIGRLLAHSPEGEDGPWPCRPVQSVLESISTDSIASGFYFGILNSRGAVWRATGGDQERELSAKYRKMAVALQIDAPFVANVLCRVSDHYDQEGKWWDERDRWED